MEKEAKELFGDMRMLTEEEIELRDAIYDDMSEPTGVNFFDLLDDIEIEKCSNCGSIPQINRWSASCTFFIKCGCGKCSEDCTSEHPEWALKKTIRNWNRYN